MSFDAHILSFRTLFRPDLAEGLEARIQFVFGDRPFRATVSGGKFEIRAGELDSPDAVITSDHGTALAVAHGRASLEEAESDGMLQIAGDRDKAMRFLDLFPLPEPAAA